MFKPADIILTYSGTRLARAILYVLNFFQKDPVKFSHVLMVCNENLGIEADKKIRLIDLEKVFEKAKTYKVIRKIDLTDTQRGKIVKKAKLCLGQEYGYTRLIMQFFDQMFYTNWFTKRLKFNGHICSGLVAWAYYAQIRIKFNGVGWKSAESDDIEDESLKDPNLWEVIAEKKYI